MRMSQCPVVVTNDWRWQKLWTIRTQGRFRLRSWTLCVLRVLSEVVGLFTFFGSYADELLDSDGVWMTGAAKPQLPSLLARGDLILPCWLVSSCTFHISRIIRVPIDRLEPWWGSLIPLFPDDLAAECLFLRNPWIFTTISPGEIKRCADVWQFAQMESHCSSQFVYRRLESTNSTEIIRTLPHIKFPSSLCNSSA